MKKSILITGSTDGIGKLAAIKLARDGHEIYLHGRKEEKLDRVISEIRELSSNESIKGFVADFSNLSAVRSMADQMINEVSHIDVLINNAGVFKSRDGQNEDGLDLRFVVNYLAPYLLTNALIPLLQKSNLERSAPRIINLSSAAQAPVSLAALSGESQLSMQESYAQSKLALTVWSFHLAKAHPGMVIIAVNPGSLLDTNMVREGYGRFWSPAEKGGDMIYDLSSSEKYENSSGAYFDNDKGGFGRAHMDAYNDEEVEKLIAETERLLVNLSGY